MTKILELVWAFLQVGITAFGGGLSTLPLIEYQLVIKNGWMTGDGFNQLVAISQVTPGPIAINAATFAGYQQAGFWGALAATLALVSAPVAALCVILAVLKRVSPGGGEIFFFTGYCDSICDLPGLPAPYPGLLFARAKSNQKHA